MLVAGATLLVQSQTEWQSETSVQIAARRLDDGRVEFGLRQRVGEDWSELSLPAQRFLLVDAPVDEWQLSDEIAVLSASVRVHLRSGVYVGEFQDEFLVYLDGQVYETNCGSLRLGTSVSTVLLETRNAECSHWVGLATVCGSPNEKCDDQRAMFFQWAHAQLGEYGADRIEFTLEDAQTIVDAVFADYAGTVAEPPAVKTVRNATTSYYNGGEHAIYLSSWGLDLDTTLHETVHAIIAKTAQVGSGHDQHFAAQMLDAWKRYMPIVDTEGARRAASDYDVAIADSAPVPAVSDKGVDVLWSLLCTEPVRSKSYCDALTGSMRPPSQTPAVAGESQPVQDYGQINSHNRYYAQIRDGSLFTTLTSETQVAEAPETTAQLRVVCARNMLFVEVWWELTRATSSSVLVRIGDGDFKRQQWETRQQRWNSDNVGYDSRVVYVVSEDAERLARDLMWAAAGETVTIQIRSGSDPFTATFDLEGLFETPVQPNLARCGR